jgi:tetratricopeptide (TPR) repeat protein
MREEPQLLEVGSSKNGDASGLQTRFQIAPSKFIRPKQPLAGVPAASSSKCVSPSAPEVQVASHFSGSTVTVSPYSPIDALEISRLTNVGVLVSDYFIPVVDFKQLVKEQDEEYPLLRQTVATVEIPSSLVPNSSSAHLVERQLVAAKVADVCDSSFTPGAVACVITRLDSSFFNAVTSDSSGRSPVSVDSRGHLVLALPEALTGKTGLTTIAFKAVDYASLRRLQQPENMADFDCSGEISVDVFIGAPPTLVEVTSVRKPPHSTAVSGRVTADVVPAREPVFQSPAMPPSVPGHCRGLAPLCIHSFRVAPETAPPQALAVNWIKTQPIHFTKCTSIALELELLQGTTPRQRNAAGAPAVQQSDVERAIVSLHTAMSKKQSAVDVIMPLLDRCIQLLMHVPLDENLVMVKKLVVVRAEVAASLAGVNLELLSQTVRTPSRAPHSAGPPSSVPPSHVSLFVRVCVEAGHAMKLTGDYNEARVFYRIALAVAECVETTSAMDTHIPFIRAIGDAELLYGDLVAAAAAYERARALAEMAQKAVEITSECPQLSSVALVLSCETDVAVCQAMQRRDDAAQHTLSRVEHVTQRLLMSNERTNFLLLAVDSNICGMVVALTRNSFQQALSFVNKAAELAAEYAEWPEHDGEVSDLIRLNIHTLVGGVRMAMALHASSKGALDECSALLREAHDGAVDPFAESPTALNTFSFAEQLRLPQLLSAWISAVAAFPLAESPDDVTEYDAVLQLAEGLVGKLSPLFVTMQLCRDVAMVVTAPAADPSSRRPVTTQVVLQLSMDPHHPMLFFLLESLVTCFITAKEYGKAVEALYRAAQIWKSCKVVREDESNATRLVGIGAYAVTHHCHWQNSTRGPAGPAAASRPTVTTHNESFAVIVDFVAQSTLLDAHNTSFERLLDAAEVHLCEAEYASALELLGKALRLADSRNVMFLLDGLFVTQRWLSKQELEDRTRLLHERRVSPRTLVAVGLVLLEIALAHEASRNFAKAKDAYEQAIAALEMLDSLSHPAAVEMLTGLARVSLLGGDIGDALLNLEWARDVFLSYHFHCGAYLQDEALVALESNLAQTEQAVKTVMQRLNYVLLPHEALFCGITVHL